jgi:hypothetical protein
LYARRRGIRVPSLVADTRVLPPPAEGDLVGALADAAERGEIEQFAEMHE